MIPPRCRPASRATTSPRASAAGWWPGSARRRRYPRRRGTPTCVSATSPRPSLVPNKREARCLAGPFGAGSDGGIAVLADATGVPFCLRQAGERDGAEVANRAELVGDELAAHDGCRASAGILRRCVRLGTRVGAGRCLLAVATLRRVVAGRDGDGRRRGPAALERQFRRPRRGRPSPGTPSPWAAPS